MHGDYKLDCIEKDLLINKSKPECIIIWLHGLGADNNDFLPIVNEFSLDVSIKFVFPNAPIMPITINNNNQIRAWYDIYNLIDIDNMVDKKGLLLSVSMVDRLIKYYISLGYNSSDIILAGFSQGGSVIYQALLTLPYKLLGAIILSSYLVKDKNLQINDINKKTSITICHGKLDNIVPYELGFASYNILKSYGYHSSWSQYPIGHNVSKEEVKDLSLWLNNLLVKKEFKKQ